MKKKSSRKTRVSRRSFIRKTKRRMRGGSAPLIKKTTVGMMERKKLIDTAAEEWFSANPNQLYDIVSLDTLPEGPMKEYTKSVYNSHNIRVIITQKDRGLLPIGVEVIMWLMDWVNKNPISEHRFTPDYNKIIGYIKDYEREYGSREPREEVTVAEPREEVTAADPNYFHR